MPDGLTVDAAGDLWVAIWAERSVRRYAPDGSLRAVLRVPAVETTSCGFAGLYRTRWHVTTATENWTDEARAEPGAGLVYRFETDATGLPSAPFRPDPNGGLRSWRDGAPDRIRTCDLRLRRPTLYPLSYRRPRPPTTGPDR